MHEERRSTARRGCCYQVGCSLNGEEFGATVKDMGLGGMRLLLPRFLAPESILEVGQIGGELARVAVRVVWSYGPEPSQQHYEVGVVYQDPPDRLDQSWVKPALSQLGFEGVPMRERRRHLRVRLQVTAELHLGERVAHCILVDMGMGGALVELDENASELVPGRNVELEVKIDQGKLPARVVYGHQHEDQGRWRYGLSFETDRATQALARLIEGYLVAMG